MNLEKEEHPNCGTPECCQQCDTAVPVQLELFPVSIYTKDTKEEVTSFPLEVSDGC